MVYIASAGGAVGSTAASSVASEARRWASACIVPAEGMEDHGVADSSGLAGGYPGRSPCCSRRMVPDQRIELGKQRIDLPL